MSQITNSGTGGGGGGGILNINWIRTNAINTDILNQTGYIPYAGVLQTFKLPLIANVGNGFAIAGQSAWRISQDVGQSIVFGNTTTSVGPAGSLSSTGNHDTVVLVCIEQDTTWQVLDSIGNPTPV